MSARVSAPIITVEPGASERDWPHLGQNLSSSETVVEQIGQMGIGLCLKGEVIGEAKYLPVRGRSCECFTAAWEKKDPRHP